MLDVVDSELDAVACRSLGGLAGAGGSRCAGGAGRTWPSVSDETVIFLCAIIALTRSAPSSPGTWTRALVVKPPRSCTTLLKSSVTLATRNC